jgi:hypothetical protein
VYTTSYSTGSLRDVDGVRCWLPCLDALDQRAVYDISIVAPRHWRVACCGKKLSTFLLGEPDTTPSRGRKITRFFTPNRIPAMSVGFYMGAVEMYKMPLYKVRARMWVGLGLRDFYSSAEAEKDNDVVVKEEGVECEREEGPDKVHIRKLDDSYYAAFKRTLPAHSTHSAETDVEVDNKRARTEDGTRVRSVQDDQAAKRRTATAPALEPGLVRSKLYEQSVQHTTLGLDISLRLLHKFTGHKFDYDEVVFIFVHELGTDFVSYDGFLLIDAKYLHTEVDVQQETPAHLMLLQAYLYSWLKSALPLSAYDCEFILHGAVGYLLNFYTEEVFGEEDGRYVFGELVWTLCACWNFASGHTR